MMMSFGMGLWGIFFMILFWGGLLMVAVWLVGLMFPTKNHESPTPKDSRLSATEILKNRYARGEITATEYETMRETLHLKHN